LAKTYASERWTLFQLTLQSERFRPIHTQQEAQLMLTTDSTRLAVSRGQQTWYHSTCYGLGAIVTSSSKNFMTLKWGSKVTQGH